MAKPTARQGAHETKMRRLIDKHQLSGITVGTRDGRLYSASAFPAAWSKIVNERRQAAIVASGKIDFTIAEITAISEKAAEDALCQVQGISIETALAALADELAKLTATPEKSDV